MGFQPPIIVSPSDKRKVRDRIRLLLIPISLLSFMLGLILIKDSTGVLVPILRGTLSINTPLSALGFGWLFANLALSGSPVAATSLALLDGGGLNYIERFVKINQRHTDIQYPYLYSSAQSVVSSTLGRYFEIRGSKKKRPNQYHLISLGINS